jgi:hypothetical protein
MYEDASGLELGAGGGGGGRRVGPLLRFGCDELAASSSRSSMVGTSEYCGG